MDKTGTEFLEQNALIFDIKRDCSEDGPGIRTTVFSKVVPFPVYGAKIRKASQRKQSFYLTLNSADHPNAALPVLMSVKLDASSDWTTLFKLTTRLALAATIVLKSVPQKRLNQPGIGLVGKSFSTGF